MNRYPWFILAALGLLATATLATADTVHLESPEPFELLMEGFELRQPGTIEVDSQGLRQEPRNNGDSWFRSLGERWFHSDRDATQQGCYAWILDAETREVVWVLDLEEAKRGDNRHHRREKTRVDLAAGVYQVFLYGGHDRLRYMSDAADRSRSQSRELDAVRADLEKCFVRVEGQALGDSKPSGRCSDALLAMVEVGDSELRRQAFELTQDSELDLYGLMEYSPGDDDPSDFGWIVDLQSGRRVWDMSDRHGRAAGGAAKNRVLRRNVDLDAGRYMLVYGTDDSHSAAAYNSAPPYDPLGWGIQIRPGEDFRPGSFRLIDTPQRLAATIDFSRTRDEEFHEQAFHLDRETDLYIFALGESTDGGWSWADHGWIVDAKTRELVWEMDGRNCTAAGGAAKNRMFDGVIRFPAGDYIAYYLADGSHSYQEWNAAAPFEPDAWGMQIASDPAQRIELVELADLAASTGLLVDLTRVRDHEKRRQRFTLESPTEIEILALGEGSDGDMYDWGYVRSVDDRRTIWEMEYRDTDHAGGASKNRVARHRMRLEPGEYEAVFETDGSHAFGDWNADAPDDPLGWGMTLRRAE